MARTRLLILGIVCFCSITSCAVVFLQMAGIVPAIGVNWGDGSFGSANGIELDEAIVVRFLAGGKVPSPFPANSVITPDLARSINFAGVHYVRYDIILMK